MLRRLGNQEDAPTCTARSARSTASVGVGVGIGGHGELNHHADIRHIDSASGDIGGDQDPDAAISKRGQGAGPLCLSQFATEGKGGEAVFGQTLGIVGRFCSSLDEDKAAAFW